MSDLKDLFELVLADGTATHSDVLTDPSADLARGKKLMARRMRRRMFGTAAATAAAAAAVGVVTTAASGPAAKNGLAPPSRFAESGQPLT